MKTFLRCYFCGLSLAVAWMGLSASVVRGADPFAEGVRPTGPLEPEEERKGFHLPADFEIKLFVAEPRIAKPMNMAFDEKGRLWVSSTLEYPFPAPLDKKGRDSIVVLEDKDGDGEAEKATTFADGLNIPTGIYPYKNGVIAWSIPNIWYFEDTDGDGKADKRTVLYGPLGWERDTHGMSSSFRRGLDGWLYITHGYNNNTVVRGKDGTEIQMNSGNIYRVRVDGSSVEQYSWGQVNPFGLAFDPLGNLFSADCHSAPIYQVLRGAYYPSFGKAHDGLGFGPTLMEHSHGSTAIAGLVYLSDDRWPPEFRDNIVIGNVMTSRINRDTLVESGTTKIAREERDFLSADDPWFRPVDMQFGPDGALYVADFYNKIIGHYEVPLLHPGRDRERGRIWRIRYKPSAHRALNLASASVETLLDEIGDSNQSRRYLATEQLVERGAGKVLGPIQDLWKSEEINWRQKAHSLWVLFRVGALDMTMAKAGCTDPSREVRTHAQKVLSELTGAAWGPGHRVLAVQGLSDPDPWVQRASADALGRHGALENIEPLLRLRHQIPAQDGHLLHGVRMALRNQMKVSGSFAKFLGTNVAERDRAAVADVAPAVPGADAASFLLDHLKRGATAREDQDRSFRHVARYGRESDLETLAELAPTRFKDDLGTQFSLFRALQGGLGQRGGALGELAKAWGVKLAGELLGSVDAGSAGWSNHPIEGIVNQRNPWFLQVRASSDGDKSAVFFCSLPDGGESLTGVLTSPPFMAPERFRFSIAGHDGSPDKSAQKRNGVRLRDADSGGVLAEAFAPRNDIAQPVQWDLAPHKGKRVYLEIADADAGSAFAWIAAGRFDPATVPMPSVSPSLTGERQQASAELAGSLQMKDMAPRFLELLKSDLTELEARSAMVRALSLLRPSEVFTMLAPLVGDISLPAATRGRMCAALAKPGVGDPYAIVVEALQSAPYRVQIKLAQTLAGNQKGAGRILDLAESGQVSPKIFQDRTVSEKLRASLGTSAEARLGKLTVGLTPLNAELAKMVERRRVGYSPASSQPGVGARVFTQHCAPCHQVDGRGGVVGPQLDGIGNRGLERLCEDVVDPNRNVDVAFRTQLIVLKDGDVISGLPRREEGETLVIADSTGKEQVIPKGSIQERRPSDISLMPENVGEVLSQEDFNHLMAFLLSKSAAGK